MSLSRKQYLRCLPCLFLAAGLFYASSAQAAFYFKDNKTLPQMWEQEFRLPLIYENYFYPKTVSEVWLVRNWYGQAIKYYLREQNFTSIGYLDRALFREAGNYKVLAFRARNFLKLGNISRALEDYEASLEAKPKFAEAVSFLAQHFYRYGNYGRAAGYYRIHVGANQMIQEELLGCMTAAGWIKDWQLQKDCRAKLTGYKQSALDRELKELNPEPDFPEDIKNITSKPDLISNIKIYLKIMAVIPQNRMTYNDRSSGRNYESNEFEALRSALNLIRKLEYLDPYDERIYSWRDFIYRRYKQDEFRKFNFIRQIGIKPDDPKGYFGLAAYYLRKKLPRKALAIYRKWLGRQFELNYVLGWPADSAATFQKLSYAYRKIGYNAHAQVLLNVEQAFRNNQGAGERFKALRGLYKVFPKSLELNQVMLEIARQNGNETMKSELERKILKIQADWEIFDN